MLELLFVYGFDWGLTGSAWGTVIAQAGMARARSSRSSAAPGLERPHPDKMRPLMRIGSRDRGAHDRAAPARSWSASAVLARVGAASLGAHQIAFQLWVFLALVLDAIAIAGQVMVGRMLGAGDARRRARGGDADDRLVGGRSARCSALVLLALGDVVPRAVHQRRAR